MVSLTRSGIIACRLLLLSALIVTTYFTTAEITHAAAREVNDKFAHLATFFMLALLADLSFPTREFRRVVWVPLILYGLAIEIVQYQIPYRSFSLLDWGADVVGVLLYSFFSMLLIRHMPLAEVQRKE